MAKDKGNGPQGGGRVIELVRECPGCGKKPEKAGFCKEHFAWFKAGLINRKGERPKDFDKKHQAFQRKQAA